MNESILFREVRTKARLELQRENITRMLRTKLSGDALARAIAQVDKQDDLGVLSRWLDLSFTLAPEALAAELDK